MVVGTAAQPAVRSPLSGQSPPDPTAGHYRDLDGLRGVLAVTVMLYHFGINVLITRVSGGLIHDAPWGAMVDFFFLLSGFVLARAYLRNPRSLRQILIERAFRLMPVHIVLMTLFAPVFLATVDRTPGELLADWTATSVYFGTERWNGPSWSMNIELYLSIILGLAATRIAVLPRRLAAGLLVLGLAAMSALAWRMALGEEHYVLRGVVGLAAGALLYRCADLAEPGAQAGTGSAWKLPALTAAMLLCVLAAGIFPVAAVFGPSIMALAVWAGLRSRSFLGKGPFAFVGTLSYTVYMVHQNLKSALLYALGRSEFGGDLAIKAVLIAAVFVAAWLLTRFVEMPAMNYGKRLSRRGAAHAAEVRASCSH